MDKKEDMDKYTVIHGMCVDPGNALLTCEVVIGVFSE